MKQFNAAFEAEYASRLEAGTIARFETVLLSSIYFCAQKSYWHLDSLDDAGRGLLSLEERQESEGDVNKAGKIDVHFIIECREVDLVRLGEIVHSLNASIEENAVKIWVAAGDVLDKCFQVLAVTDIVCKTSCLVAVPANQGVDSVVSTADNHDFQTLADEFLGHYQANT